MTVIPAIPAAQYLRKSTEHQQYSLENQADAIQQYAAQKGMTVVETYSDKTSGMALRRRIGSSEAPSGRNERKARLQSHSGL